MSPTRVTVAGVPGPSGAYLLRIRLRSACDVLFGRFNDGKAVHLPTGDYVYVGSAMGRTGSATLANRLLRHARRSGAATPHPIYDKLVAQFRAMDRLRDKQGRSRSKSLRWHIDYLLDRPEAELIQVFLICSTERQEAAIARRLIADPATEIVIPGLGSSDDKGSTHLLRMNADEAWWDRFTAGYQIAG